MKIVRLYDDNLPFMEYNEKKLAKLDNLHWGQRKLLMSEIDFLTRYYEKFDKNKKKYVLYIGASPGHHLNYLIKMFPDITYFLYDKVKNYVTSDKAVFFEKYFDAKEAKKYANMNLFVICDIRSLDMGKVDKTTTSADLIVFDDMKKQKEWCDIMKPKSALLKFRSSWHTPKTLYYDGDLFFQAWNKNHSIEMRLVPNFDKPLKLWDNKKLEGNIFYYNVITRRQELPRDILGINLGKCIGSYFDSIIEADILKRYVEKFEKVHDKKLVSNRVCDLSLSITIELSKWGKNRVSGKYIKNIGDDSSVFRVSL